jgi:hypothetical protein
VAVLTFKKIQISHNFFSKNPKNSFGYFCSFQSGLFFFLAVAQMKSVSANSKSQPSQSSGSKSNQAAVPPAAPTPGPMKQSYTLPSGKILKNQTGGSVLQNQVSFKR